MPDYRLYFLDDSGHFLNLVEFACDDDAAARAQADQHRTGAAMELWERARFIQEYDAEDF
jgi:hypothetical protein